MTNRGDDGSGGVAFCAPLRNTGAAAARRIRAGRRRAGGRHRCAAGRPCL